MLLVRTAISSKMNQSPAHYAGQVRDYLNQLFPDRWIGRRDPLKWATRAFVLTPFDFFLGVSLKAELTPQDRKTSKNWTNYARFTAKCQTRMHQKMAKMPQNSGSHIEV